MTCSGSPQQDHILAIDDEAGFLTFLKVALECEGYRVHLATSPNEAITFYRERWRDIRVVILDYLMPQMSGDVVFDELQRSNPDVRVVLLTTCDESTAEKLFHKGLCGYLQKPFDLQDLAQKVRDAIHAPGPAAAASPASV